MSVRFCLSVDSLTYLSSYHLFVSILYPSFINALFESCLTVRSMYGWGTCSCPPTHFRSEATCSIEAPGRSGGRRKVKELHHFSVLLYCQDILHYSSASMMRRGYVLYLGRHEMATSKIANVKIFQLRLTPFYLTLTHMDGRLMHVGVIWNSAGLIWKKLLYVMHEKPKSDC